jgi:MFS family permease
MLRIIAPVGALFAGIGLLLMGNGLQGTLVPVRAEMEGFSTIDIGILGSQYYVGFVAGCLGGPLLVRRAGHIRAFTALVAVASIVPIAHALLVHPVIWWMLRAATGACFAGLYLVIESWLNERCTNETRGAILSIYTTINLAAITLGQLMLTLHDPVQFPLFGLASILVSLAAVPVALTKAEGPAPPAAVRLRPLRLYRLSPVGFVGCVAVGLANGSLWALGPVFALASGQAIAGVALFMSITVVAGALSQWPFGRASDRTDRRRVIVLASGLACAAGLALAYASRNMTAGVLPFAFLFGAFALPLYALCVAHANDVMRSDELVEASSGLLLANGAGSVLGPVVASGLMTVAGASGLFLFTALVHAFMVGFAVYRMGRRRVTAEDHQFEFVRVPESSPAVATLDPRKDEGRPPT